jgi:hypothetical protein
VDPFFAWLEDSAFSTWIRSSPSVAFGFPGILVLHALGMAFLAGASIALSLCTLGLAPGLAAASFRGYVPVLWIALILNVFSGVLLVIGYPTKALTNPLFYVKLLLILGGWIAVQRLLRQILREGTPARGQLLAFANIACWTGAIAAGRFLAYTHTRLLVDHWVRH